VEAYVIHNFKNAHYTYKSQPTKTSIEYSIILLNEQQHLCTFRQQQSVASVGVYEPGLCCTGTAARRGGQRTRERRATQARPTCV